MFLLKRSPEGVRRHQTSVRAFPLEWRVWWSRHLRSACAHQLFLLNKDQNSQKTCKQYWHKMSRVPQSTTKYMYQFSNVKGKHWNSIWRIFHTGAFVFPNLRKDMLNSVWNTVTGFVHGISACVFEVLHVSQFVWKYDFTFEERVGHCSSVCRPQRLWWLVKILFTFRFPFTETLHHRKGNNFSGTKTPLSWVPTVKPVILIST